MCSGADDPSFIVSEQSAATPVAPQPYDDPTTPPAALTVEEPDTLPDAPQTTGSGEEESQMPDMHVMAAMCDDAPSTDASTMHSFGATRLGKAFMCDSDSGKESGGERKLSQSGAWPCAEREEQFLLCCSWFGYKQYEVVAASR